MIFIHESAVVDPGVVLGDECKIWHNTHLMKGAVIGERCNFGQNVFIGEGVILGNNVKVQNNVSIFKGVICEDDVFLGPSMTFTNVINPRSAVDRKSEFRGTVIRKGVSIGANSTILCGITIGTNSFISAGAMVIKDVPNYSLVVGNPGRIVGWMSEYGERLYFNTMGEATCTKTGNKYRLEKNDVIKVS